MRGASALPPIAVEESQCVRSSGRTRLLAEPPHLWSAVSPFSSFTSPLSVCCMRRVLRQLPPYSLAALGYSCVPLVELLGWHLDDPDRLGIGSSSARVGLLGRRSRSWRIAADIDDVVRHLSTEGSLAEQRFRIGRRRQCADRQRHLGSCDCVRMVSDFCRFAQNSRAGPIHPRE